MFKFMFQLALIVLAQARPMTLLIFLRINFMLIHQSEAYRVLQILKPCTRQAIAHWWSVINIVSWPLLITSVTHCLTIMLNNRQLAFLSRLVGSNAKAPSGNLIHLCVVSCWNLIHLLFLLSDSNAYGLFFYEDIGSIFYGLSKKTDIN